MRLARYWSSPPLIRGLARALKTNGEGRQHRAGLSSCTRSEKRSGWDYASVGHLVCLIQACVKGLYLYLYLYLEGGTSTWRCGLALT